MSVDRTASLTPRQRFHSKLAKQLISAVGGLEDAEEVCRPTRSTLSDYGHPNVMAFMPLDVIEDLEALAPEPIVTKALARRAGYMLVRRPVAEAGAWGRSLRDLSKEFGDVVGKVTDCLGDPLTPGAVTGDEIKECDLIAELDQLAEIVAQMRATAVREMEG